MNRRTVTRLRHLGRPAALGIVWLVALPLTAGCWFDAYYFFVPASRAPCDSIPNGCGPEGATGLLVPDCPFGLVCFKLACDRHDLCYVDCGVPREACDSNFGKAMLGLCAADYVAGDPRLDKCLTLAFIYWQAVVRFGGPSYDACCPAPGEDPAFMRVVAAPAIMPPYEDLDDDLLPDAWERATGCDPTARDTLVDMDGDGFNNLEEFVQGTDPADAASVPVMPQR